MTAMFPERIAQKALALAAALMGLWHTPALAQKELLRKELVQIAGTVEGMVGVGIMHIESRDTFSINGSTRFPMQSVYKFPLALAVLHDIDEGRLAPEQRIHITEDDYFPDTWSPLASKYPEANTDVGLLEILNLTVSQSDNIGCDILFGLVGGPGKAGEYIRGLGIADISIASTERRMHEDRLVQFQNWCTPVAMTQLLDVYFSREVLSQNSHDLLWKFMVETTTGRHRLRGLLPEATTVAHKTGTGGRDDENVLSALNDAGILILPDGSAVAITVFITKSPDEEKELEAVVAKIARSVYTYYSTGK